MGVWLGALEAGQQEMTAEEDVFPVFSGFPQMCETAPPWLYWLVTQPVCVVKDGNATLLKSSEGKDVKFPSFN